MRTVETPSDTLSGNPKLGIYLAATGFGFTLIPALAVVGVAFLWVGLAVSFRGPVILRWGATLVVALLLGWAAITIRPWVSASRPASAPVRSTTDDGR
jgi:hypothetical protein